MPRTTKETQGILERSLTFKPTQLIRGVLVTLTTFTALLATALVNAQDIEPEVPVSAPSPFSLLSALHELRSIKGTNEALSLGEYGELAEQVFGSDPVSVELASPSESDVNTYFAAKINSDETVQLYIALNPTLETTTTVFDDGTELSTSAQGVALILQGIAGEWAFTDFDGEIVIDGLNAEIYYPASAIDLPFLGEQRVYDFNGQSLTLRNEGIRVDGVTQVSGTASNDIFDFSSTTSYPGMALSVNGMEGIDTLIGPTLESGTVWDIGGVPGTNVSIRNNHNIYLFLAGVESLVGGPQADIFEITSAVQSDIISINTGQGNDTLIGAYEQNAWSLNSDTCGQPLEERANSTVSTSDISLTPIGCTRTIDGGISLGPGIATLNPSEISVQDSVEFNLDSSPIVVGTLQAGTIYAGTVDFGTVNIGTIEGNSGANAVVIGELESTASDDPENQAMQTDSDGGVGSLDFYVLALMMTCGLVNIKRKFSAFFYINHQLNFPHIKKENAQTCIFFVERKTSLASKTD
ncbi:MAG: hypothetical protein ACI9Y1_002953 [Lentisphaeria bacterium]